MDPAALVSAADWRAPAVQERPLPYGWTDAAVAAAGQMAESFGMDPLGELAIWHSESGLQPHLEPEGLDGLTPIVESEMHWPAGTVLQVVRGPVLDQLQAIFAFWAHVQERYAGGSFAAKAAAWGVDVNVAVYAFQGFVMGAQRASGPGSVLARAGELTYEGNRGLDYGAKGVITVADLVRRLEERRRAILADPKGSVIWRRWEAISTLPNGLVPPLGDFWRAVRGPWRALTGRDVRMDPEPG